MTLLSLHSIVELSRVVEVRVNLTLSHSPTLTHPHSKESHSLPSHADSSSCYGAPCLCPPPLALFLLSSEPHQLAPLENSELLRKQSSYITDFGDNKALL